MKNYRIGTRDRELYEKLNMLKLSNEVLLKKVSSNNINRIINSVNRKEQILRVEKIGDYTVLQKINPFNFNVYLKKNNKNKL